MMMMMMMMRMFMMMRMMMMESNISLVAVVVVGSRETSLMCLREGFKKKNRFFLGKGPKLWVGGGQES